MYTKIKISTLWIIIMFNMLFANIFSIIVELVNKNTLGIIGELTTTITIAVIITNIPILMIYFSQVSSYKVNHIGNIIAGAFALIYIIGDESLKPHFIIWASIEVILIVMIICIEWKWPNNDIQSQNIC